MGDNMLNYKKIGDTINTRELNAVIYLLQKFHRLTENIILTPHTYTGTYGTYTLNLQSDLSHESYTPADTDFIITTEPLLSDDYALTVRIKKLNGESRKYTVELDEDGCFTIPLSEFDTDELLSAYATVEVI